MTDKIQRRRGRPRAFADKTGETRIQSLDRALTVLRALADSPGQTLTELARRLDQSPATLYRILITFEANEFVESEAATQTWSIGQTAFAVGTSFLRKTGLVERARPFMQQLLEATGETANLGIRRGDHVVFVSQAESHETIRAFFPPGTRSPLHASGIGKALLASTGDEMLRRWLKKHVLETFTDQTIIDPEHLMNDLKRTAQRGYAVDNEEKEHGMRCIAAPVFDARREPVAGLSISGPVNRVSVDRAEPLGHLVRDAARALSQAIGAG